MKHLRGTPSQRLIELNNQLLRETNCSWDTLIERFKPLYEQLCDLQGMQFEDVVTGWGMAQSMSLELAQQWASAVRHDAKL